MKKYIPSEIKALINRKLNRSSSKSLGVFQKLKLVPRYTNTSAVIEGKEIHIPDSASFLFMYDEIFKTEIYKFKTDNDTPYIIDGGANIGLASVYFKKLYPNAEIVAFEPDSDIFSVLKLNLDTYGFNDIKLINKGLWNIDANLNFVKEGADAGLIQWNDNNKSSDDLVPVTSLRPYLNRKVDFLKLDIEGAETVVLRDIADSLVNVERIFVEYHSFLRKEQTLDEIISILKNSNFRLYISSPGIKSKSPFVKINTYNDMDMQLNIYGFKSA